MEDIALRCADTHSPPSICVLHLKNMDWEGNMSEG
jgi:hypothetical protein